MTFCKNWPNVSKIVYIIIHEILRLNMQMHDIEETQKKRKQNRRLIKKTKKKMNRT